MSDYNPELLQKPTDSQEVARQRLNVINIAVTNLKRAAESLGITDQAQPPVLEERVVETAYQPESSIQVNSSEVTDMHRAAQDAVAQAFRDAA